MATPKQKHVNKIHLTQLPAVNNDLLLGRYGYDPVDLTYIGMCIVEFNVLSQLLISCILKLEKLNPDSNAQTQNKLFNELHNKPLGQLVTSLEKIVKTHNFQDADFIIDFTRCKKNIEEVIKGRNALIHANGIMQNNGNYLRIDEYGQLFSKIGTSAVVLDTSDIVTLLQNVTYVKRELTTLSRNYFDN